MPGQYGRQPVALHSAGLYPIYKQFSHVLQNFNLVKKAVWLHHLILLVSSSSRS